MILSILGKLIVIFALLAVGYIARKKEVLDANIQLGLSRIVLVIAMPALVLSSANVSYTADRMQSILFIFAFAIAYYLLSIPLSHLAARALHLEDDRRRVFVTLTVFANVGFLGYPIVSIFLPETGVFYAVFFNIIFQMLFFTYGIGLMAKRKSMNPLTLLRDPNIISAILMIVLFVLQLKLPSPVQETLSILGGLCTPLSMLVIGSMLAQINLRELFTDKSLYIVSFLRLLLIPAVGIVILRLLGATPEIATVVTIMLAMPAASSTAMLGERYKCDPAMCSKGIVLSTLFCLVTIPLVGLALEFVFG
ncbi:MAG: AEC family transporter [Acetanaerobacterium sp.]